MKCYEYQAKEVFRKYGIPVSKAVVIDDADKLGSAIKEVGLPAVIKSQVLTGGRGKAGGIKVVNSLEEAAKETTRLLGSEIKGLKVNKLLIEQKIDIVREYYVGVITDRDSYGPVAIVSSMGGMNVEDVSKDHPDKISKMNIDYVYGLSDYQGRILAFSAGIDKKDVNAVVSILRKLYKLYCECDAELTEINPLAVTGEGAIIAADGRLNIDDSSLYRHPDLKQYRDYTLEVKLDEEARIKYVELDGDIGIISSGAGMTMTVMDQIIAAGGNPANFLDGGLGLLDKAPAVGLDLLLDSGVKAILFSTYTGGRSDTMARKFVDAIEANPRVNIPVIVRFQGLNQEEAEKICRNSSYKNIHIAHNIDESAKMAVKLAGRGK